LGPHACGRTSHHGVFEVDLRAGELRKNGSKLKLARQPFQVLAILLERPGELVTREELQKRLWPDTFVDVDHNLNTAINRIREVLGDTRDSPLNGCAREPPEKYACLSLQGHSVTLLVGSKRWPHQGTKSSDRTIGLVRSNKYSAS